MGQLPSRHVQRVDIQFGPFGPKNQFNQFQSITNPFQDSNSNLNKPKQRQFSSAFHVTLKVNQSRLQRTQLKNRTFDQIQLDTND